MEQRQPKVMLSFRIVKLSNKSRPDFDKWVSRSSVLFTVVIYKPERLKLLNFEK